jgi:hypothetical protein
MFRTFHRKWWRLYLTLARAWARLTTRQRLEQRDWFGKLSTNKLLLSLWLFGAALYTAAAFYIPDSKCGSRVIETAASYSVKEDVQPTGSVGQTPPTLTNSRSPKVETEPPTADGPTQRAEVSLAASAYALPSVWGISVIDPTTLREGWTSGKYLTPKEDPQAQAGLSQKPAQPGPETSAVSEELQPESSATPKNLRKQRGWKWRPRPAFRYELGFYPTR